MLNCPSGSTEAICASDFDGDGDLDIIMSRDRKLICFENLDGKGQFSATKTITSFSQYPKSVYLKDLDNDNDKDIVVAIYDSHGYENIIWLENVDGKGTFDTPKSISSTVNHPLSVFSADLDNDGDNDVLSAIEGDNKIAWYENIDATGNFSEQKVLCETCEQAVFVTAADIDDDNDMDIIAAVRHDANIIWFENTDGKGTFSNKKIISNEHEHIKTMLLKDLDLDGDLDIIGSSGFIDNISWYENIDGMGQFGDQKPISEFADSYQTAKRVQGICLIDFDGDGDLDVLSSWDIGKEIALYENLDGKGSFGEKTTILEECEFPAFCVADFDADNDNDLFVAANNRIEWYENLINLTDIQDNQTNVLNNFQLYQNYPNPFNPNTTIKYNLQKPGKVILTIYNLSGEEVETLVNGFKAAGEHEVKWQPEGFASGIYFVRLETGNKFKTKKLVLQK
jgi:hypothetical protein